MQANKYILLTFDIEEFDLPIEYGAKIEFSDQIEISKKGLLDILKLLDHYKISSTFYVTANFALNNSELIKQISNNHEIASHGYYHSSFKVGDLATSKNTLEEIIQKPVNGFRMARMMEVEQNEIFKAGYLYNSSLNPTYIPGRYNNFRKKRTVHITNGLINLPTAVSPILRIPLFWLSFKNFPIFLFNSLSKWSLKTDGYLNLYFHSWEFNKSIDNLIYKIPPFIKKKSDKELLLQLSNYIIYLKQYGQFVTTSEYLSISNLIK